MRIGVKGLAAGALTLAAMALGGGGVAQAQTGPVLENGKTKAVYDYRAAIRERVFIPQPGIDQDGNGQMDWVTADILRPSEGSATNKMPAIIDPCRTTRRSVVAPRASAWPTGTTTASTTAGRCSTTTTSCRAATRTSSAR